MSNYTQQCQTCGATIDGGEYCDRCKPRVKAQSQILVLARTIQALEYTNAAFRAENGRLTHAFNMLQHDMVEANRVHGQRMNEMSAEIERLRAVIDAHVSTLVRELGNYDFDIDFEDAVHESVRALKNALGGSK